MTDPQTIVEGMTRAQRREILATSPRGRIVSTGQPTHFQGYAMRRTVAVLKRLDLANIIGASCFVLTPLGEAVRTHLEKESKK